MPVAPIFHPVSSTGNAFKLMANRFADSSYRVFDRQIPVDGGEITVRCCHPIPQENESAGFPILVFMHGGGTHHPGNVGRGLW
jgi:hypothetical protein